MPWSLFVSAEARCAACGLHESGCFVGGEGNPHASIVLVSEAPGEHESYEGRPFVGRAGSILNGCLDDADLPRSSVWICNAVRHRPTTPLGRNRKPLLEEIDACRGFLVDDIRDIKPKVIVALGDVALTSLIGKTLGGITQHRLRTIWSEEFNAWIIATNHPAYALRRYAERKWIVDALIMAKRIADDGGVATGQETEIEVIESVAHAKDARDRILRSDGFHYDWESNGLHLARSLGFCCSIATRPRHAFVFRRFRQGWQPRWSDPDAAAIDDILRVLFLSLVPKGGFHIAFDNCITRTTLGVWPNAVRFCGQQAHQLLYNHLGPTAHALKVCASLYTDMGRYDDELDAWLVAHGYTVKGKPDIGKIWLAPDEMVDKYNGKDSDASFRLEPILVPRLQAAGLWHVFTHERMPLVVEHQEIDRHGLRGDTKYLPVLSRNLADGIATLQAQINAFAGDARPPTKKGPGDPRRPINPGSAQQLAWLLFDHLGLPILGRTETGAPSTNKEVLKQLEEGHDIVPMIELYKAYVKIKGTYVDGTHRGGKRALAAVIDEDGYVRMSTNVGGTETHRFTTGAPFSPHTFPKVRKVAGTLLPSVRGLIIPDEGYAFIERDFSSQEWVIQAIIAGQWDMVDAILDRGEDVHELVTRDLGGLRKSDFLLSPGHPDGYEADGLTWRSWEAFSVYKSARTKFKSTSFAIMFRAKARKLARMAFGCTADRALGLLCKRADETGVCPCEAEASEAIMQWFERYEAIRWWQYEQIKSTRQTGMSRGVFGTYRTLPAINERDAQLREEAERMAVNFPVQNGGAHVMIRALLRAQARFRGKPPLRAAFPGYATVSQRKVWHHANGDVKIGPAYPRRLPVRQLGPEPFAEMAASNPYRFNDQETWAFPGRVLVSIHDQLIAQVRKDLVEEGDYILRTCMEAPYPELAGRSLRTDGSITYRWGG